jgi:hypothetical protein
MIFALLDASAVIDVVHLQAAIAFWEYCQESARLIFAANAPETGDPLEDRILEFLRQAPTGMTRTDIHAAFQRHIPGKALVVALAALRDKGLAVVSREETAGRPAERWHRRQVCEISVESENSQPHELSEGVSSLPALPSQAQATNNREVFEI